MTGIPTWTSGEVLTASDVNSWFVPLAAVKPGDTSIASSTSLTNDPDLVLAVASNATYRVDAFLDYEGNTNGSGDFKAQFTVPSGATLAYTHFGLNGSGNVGSPTILAASASYTYATNGSGVKQGIVITGTLIVSSTSGNLQLQWAQGESNSTATILHAGSSLMARRIA